MKNTKICIAAILMFIATWLFFGTLIWFLNDLSFKETLGNPYLFVFMFGVGWIPSAFVIDDLMNKL